VFSTDLNDDGVQDYLVISSVQDENQQNFFQLSYLDNNFQPLYGEQSHIRFAEGTLRPNWSRLRLLPYHLRGIGRIYVPIMKTLGLVGELDRPPVFDFPSENEVIEGVF